jgi:hypothetical protein
MHIYIKFFLLVFGITTAYGMNTTLPVQPNVIITENMFPNAPTTSDYVTSFTALPMDQQAKTVEWLLQQQNKYSGIGVICIAVVVLYCNFGSPAHNNNWYIARFIAGSCVFAAGLVAFTAAYRLSDISLQCQAIST